MAIALSRTYSGRPELTVHNRGSGTTLPQFCTGRGRLSGSFVMVIWARLFVQIQTSFVLVESGHCNDGKLSHFLLVQPRCDAGSLGLASLV